MSAQHVEHFIFDKNMTLLQKLSAETIFMCFKSGVLSHVLWLIVPVYTVYLGGARVSVSGDSQDIIRALPAEGILP